MDTATDVVTTSPSMEDLVRTAQDGSTPALEMILARLQNKVYNLAVKMLCCPEDSRDATQEILLRVTTNLRGFRHESAFMTWVYRITVNYLISARKGRLEGRYTFESFGLELDENLAELVQPESPTQADVILMEEVKIGCTTGMLLCLDRPHRMTYILGEILELESEEAAPMLSISAATFRKRLSRARTDIVTFMQAKCGLVNQANACRCRRRVAHAIAIKRIDPHALVFAHDADRAAQFPQVLQQIRRLEYHKRAVALYRSHPQLKNPAQLNEVVRTLLDHPTLQSDGGPQISQSTQQGVSVEV